jgi:hypothetical protein
MADSEQVRQAILNAIFNQASTQSATNVLALAQAFALVAGTNEPPSGSPPPAVRSAPPAEES